MKVVQEIDDRHVLVVNQFTLPRTEGGITRHVDLFDNVQGWRATFIAGNRSYSTQRKFETEDERFILLAVPNYSGSLKKRALSWLIYFFGALLAGFKVKNVDAVYASSPQLLAPLAGLVIAKLRRVPFVLEIRDLWPETFLSAGLIRRGGMLHRSLRALELLLVRNADEIVTVTVGWEEHFAQSGADLSRYHVVPNGANAAPALTSAERVNMRESLGLSGTVAVFAGSHGPKDGLDEVLDAARSLPEVSFLLLGDGVEKERLARRAQRESLTNVTFHDYVPKSELPRYLSACDIGIHCVAPLSVFREGMSPNKLYDYLSVGLPIVSNAGAGISRIVGEEECGFVGETGDITRGIVSVLQANSETRNSWHSRARLLAENRFSRSDAGAEIERVLAVAVQRGARPLHR